MNRTESKYSQWHEQLAIICIEHGIRIFNYDQETIRNYYADGLTPWQTYKELLSELELDFSTNENEKLTISQ